LSSPEGHGEFVVTGWLNGLGWAATLVMAVAVAVMIATPF
jgi:hypothetical protein